MPKRIYVGVLTRVPVPVTVDESNVDTYFTVQNGSRYYFACAGGVWTSNNKGVHGTTATTTLVAKHSFSSISFDYSYSGELGYDQFTLTVAGIVVAKRLSGSTTTKSFTGPLKVGDKIELKYEKDTSGNRFDDCGTLSNLIVSDEEITGYEIKEVARKVKKVYVGAGVDGKARKVKKAYVGVGGVARLCWCAGELAHLGACAALSVGRYYFGATTVGNYALFGGGRTFPGHNTSTTVDAYNSQLTRSTPTGLSGAREHIIATTVGNYALFGGGPAHLSVDAYNSQLTKSTPTGLSTTKTCGAATTVGDYALFGGGDYNDRTAIVDAYNSQLTKSTPTELSEGRHYLAATTVGNYALFGGGEYNDITAIVDAYNSQLTRSTPTGLSESRRNLAATTVGNYALFGGGDPFTSIRDSTTVDAYNSQLTRSTPTGLSEGRRDHTATTVGNYALFGGGYVASGAIDVYTVD